MAKAAKRKAGARPAKSKPGTAAPVAPRKGRANLVDPRTAENFNQVADQWQRLEESVQAATKKRRKFEKETVKKSGFTIAQMRLSLLVSTPEGEALVKARMANEVLVYAYMGKPLGDQLQMLLVPDKVDPEKEAYAQGEATSAANKPLKPPFDPDTKEYRAFTKGYQDHQTKLVQGGLSKLDKAKVKTTAAETRAAGRASRGDVKPARKPQARGLSPSGVKAAADRAEGKTAGADAGPPRSGLAGAAMTRGEQTAEHFADEGPDTKH